MGTSLWPNGSILASLVNPEVRNSDSLAKTAHWQALTGQVIKELWKEFGPFWSEVQLLVKLTGLLGKTGKVTKTLEWIIRPLLTRY